MALLGCRTIESSQLTTKCADLRELGVMSILRPLSAEMRPRAAGPVEPNELGIYLQNLSDFRPPATQIRPLGRIYWIIFINRHRFQTVLYPQNCLLQLRAFILISFVPKSSAPKAPNSPRKSIKFWPKSKSF